MKSMLAVAGTIADYERIFEAERLVHYPVVDAFEERMGAAIARHKLEDAARVLACPLKTNPPNWQHGRVLYAWARAYAERLTDRSVRVLDIGTAKGFSALCLLWAFQDAGCQGHFHSLDVLDPLGRVRRNTVVEHDGFKTLAETLAPWPEAMLIQFHQSTGLAWLMSNTLAINCAFIDGKHDGDVVLKEGKLIADRQESGDVVMFDDVHIPGVARAVSMLDCFDVEYLEVKPERKYAIGVRR